MAIRKELMERDGHLYEVEIIDENTIGSVKHISGQYNDLPPAGDVIYKENTVLLRCLTYIRFDHIGLATKNWTLS